MIEQSVSLASNGVVKVPGYEQMVRFGYTKNLGVYRLHVDATGEWEGLTIRCFWHVPDGKAPASSLVVDGYVDVPASVTAQPGNGCITFEGSDGTKTVTSADLRYRVSANSGTEDGATPEPGTPAWQQLVDAVHTDATAAEQAKTDAQTAAEQAGASAKNAWQALSDTITAKEDALKAIGDKQTAATQAVDTARDKALKQVEASTEAAQTAASEAATSAGNADQSAQKAADSLQELKNGIAAGNFKGEKGDKGDTGPVGPIGPRGEQGPQGPTGATGATGPQGEKGEKGETGAQGPAGADGKDGLDAPQIDDSVISAENPWSSRKIIETLCPPISETGNPVVCYPVAEYPLGVVAEWEPTQEGSGEPLPDNVRPIKGRDSVTVERCGENLLNPKENAYVTYTPYGLTITYIGDNKVHLSGTYQEDGGSFVILDTKQKLLAGKGLKITGFTTAGTKQNYTLYGLRTKDETVIAMMAEFAKGDVIDMTVAVVVSVSQPPAAYTPYISQAATLTLPRTIYGGTVDAVTGKGQEAWKLIDSYAGEDLPGKWISDRDVYASGTTPTTGAQVAYKLPIPISIASTGAQPIPALSGVNTVLTDADSATVTGRADPIKRITDLEDAVASMTTT